MLQMHVWLRFITVSDLMSELMNTTIIILQKVLGRLEKDRSSEGPFVFTSDFLTHTLCAMFETDFSCVDL